jgi:hypothetical protein
MSEQKSFFSTLPGILTAFAGLLTAIVGLILALHQIGVIGPGTNKGGKPTPIENKKPGNGVSKDPKKETTDGWAIIGYVEQGDYYDLALNVHGARPAIGQKYVAVKDFRLIQKRQPQSGEQTITLGMVHRGDMVEVLDLYLEPPSTKRMPVYAKLRAVLHPIGEASR